MDTASRQAGEGAGADTAAGDEVRLVHVRLDDGAAAARLEPTLSADERARAGRFVFPVHARRFVVARGALRAVLGEVVGAPPGALRFAYGPQGKPSLPDAPWVSFNLTHSGDRAVVAVTRERRLGVDIEAPRPVRDPLRLARRFFAAGELEELERLPEVERLAGFLHGWTRKEAFLKAIGTGLAGGLGSFDVSLTPGAEAVFRRLGPDAGDASWQLLDRAPEPGWFGAVVVEGGPVRLAERSWSPDAP